MIMYAFCACAFGCSCTNTTQYAPLVGLGHTGVCVYHVCMYIFVYIYIYICIRKEQETEPNRTNRIEPFNFGTHRNRTLNRTENHDAFKKCRPNRIETETIIAKPNRYDDCSKSPEPKRIEPSRLLPE